MNEFENLLIPKLGMMAKMVRNMQDSKINDKNITSKQSMILGYIIILNNNNKIVNQKNIEKKFHLTASTVTSLIEKLEKSGYITRTISETDSRCNEIKPTQKAQDLNAEILKSVEDIETAVVDGISPEEQKIFEDILNKMFRNIIKMKEDYKNDKTTC